MLVAFPVLLFFSFSEKRKEIMLASLSVVCAAGIFLGIRAWVLSKSTHSEYEIALLNPLLLAKDPLQRFSNELRVLGYYLRLLIYPRPLVYDYSYNQIPLINSFDVLSIISGLIYLSALVFGIIGFLKKQLLAAGVLFYLITISVFSNIFFLVSVSMAERFAYIPSLGFCMVLTLLLARWTNAKLSPTGAIDFSGNKKLLISAGFFVNVYSFMTISRNRDWKDNITLFSHDIEHQQENARAHCFLGNELLKSAEVEQDKARFTTLNLQGIAELKKSLAIYPQNEDALSSIGNGYTQIDSFDVAEKYFKEAGKINPATESNLAYLYLRRGSFDQAISLSEKILKRDPKNVDVLICAGIAYGSVKKYDNAIHTLSSAAQIQPSSGKIYYYLSIAYKFKGDSANYMKYAQKAARLDPSFR
jgi:tetratricopeptide (TPR) repeat protein